MKSNLVKNGLILFVIILFVLSSVLPVVFGTKSKLTEEDIELKNLTFMCSYDNDYSKLNYYKEHLLLRDISNDGVAADVIESEKEELTTPVGLPMEAASVGPMDSAWPMQSHDTHHTGRGSYITVDTSAEIWRFYSSGSVESTPVIDSDGIIYFKGAYNYLDRYLIAVYPNGTLKWRYNTGGLIWGSSPAIADDGTIYIGSWDTKLYAINPNGTLKWAFSSGGSISSSPAIAEDGTIYFGTMSSGNSIVAVNPNGTLKWKYETGYSIAAGPGIGDDGTVYIGSGDTYLYALYPNGTLRWRFKTGDYIKGSPSIGGDGTIYIGSYDDYFYAINPDGTEKWKFNSGWGTDNCAAISADGTIYVGTDKLYARYPDGSERWSFNLGTNRWIGLSSPAVSADGLVYIGTIIGDGSGGEIISISPDGFERWRKKIANDGVQSSPSIAEDGTIYIGSYYEISKGYLHAFGTVEDNEPPTPPIITGATNGNVGDSYTYTFVSNDPENYPLKYYVEWGDNTSTGWTWEYDSGKEVKLSHTWSKQGTYMIKAKVMDISNYESEWGTLIATMPVNYHSVNQWISNTLLFQIFGRILNRLQ